MRMRVAVLAVIVLSALAVGAAGCDSQQRDLLARAFQQKISDGRLDMALSVTQGGGDLVTVTATGPFHSNGPNTLPSFDFAIDFGLHTLGDTHGASFDAISTGDDVFVRYDGVTYDVGKDKVAAYMRRAQRQARKLGDVKSLGDLQRLGLHLESWFPNSRVLGDEDFHGEQVTHLQGDIDVGAVVSDLTRFVAKNTLEGRRAPQLTPGMIRQLEKAIKNPTFDVLVDKASGGFRRIAAQMGIDVPGAPPLGMKMRFDLLDVGKPQTIAAAAGGRPIGELLDLLSQKYGLDFRGRLGATTS